MHLTVITPTYQRPRQLATVLQCFQQQHLAGIEAEHIVISDGPEPVTKNLCRAYGAIHLEAEKINAYGSNCRDMGIENAKGEYLAFWDDDNWYDPACLASLLSAAWGSDIGTCKIRHFKGGSFARIPNKQGFRNGDIDSANLCVRAEVARLAKWPQGPRENDIGWLRRLQRAKPDLVVSQSPVVVATHLPARLG